MRTTTRTLLAGAAALALAPAAAHADSVAYVSGGDLWLTTTDGARQFQVTTGGGYTGVAQADDGTLAAVVAADGHVRRLDRLGNVLSDISTPVSADPGTAFSKFNGPFDIDIAPSGKTIGYGFVHEGFSNDPFGGGISAYTENGAAYTRADALTGFTDDGYKYARDWDAPDFIDDQTVLVSNGPGTPSDPIAVETLGTGSPKSWFTDPENTHPLEATISRDRRTVVAVKGPDRKALYVYRVGDAKLLSDQVFRCYVISDTDAAFSYRSPTINAAATRMWWASGRGLYTAPIGDMRTACADGVEGAELLAGASSPDWGPADVPAGRPATGGGAAAGGSAGAPGGGAGAQTGGGQGGAGGAGVSVTTLSVSVPKVRLARALSRGLTVRVGGGSGTVRITARAGSAKVGSGKGGAKSGTVTIRFTKAGARRLRRARRAKLTLTITRGSDRATTRVSIKR